MTYAKVGKFAKQSGKTKYRDARSNPRERVRRTAEWYTLVWKFGSTTAAQPMLLAEAKNSTRYVMVFNPRTEKPFLRTATSAESAANFLKIALKTSGLGHILCE